MTHLRKKFLTLFIIFTATLLLGTFAWAKGKEDPHTGAPPHGLHISGDFGGQKANGVITIEYINYNPLDGGADYARVCLRLRQGKILTVFYKDVFPEVESRFYPEGNSGDIQNAIINQMEDQVIASIFPGATTLVLKDIEEFEEVRVYDYLNGLVFYVVTDIVVAAN